MCIRDSKKTATGHFGLNEKPTVAEYRLRTSERPAILDRKLSSQGTGNDKIKNNKTVFAQITDTITEVGRLIEKNNQGEHRSEQHKRQLASDSTQGEKLRHKTDEKPILPPSNRQRGDSSRAMRRSSGHRILSANYMERRIRIDKIVRYINKILSLIHI